MVATLMINHYIWMLWTIQLIGWHFCITNKKTNNISFHVKLTAKYMDTGTYLRPHDMLFCIERTKFPEEQIVAWFKRKVNIYYSSRVILLHENHGIAIAMSSSHAVSMLGLNILQGWLEVFKCLIRSFTALAGGI